MHAALILCTALVASGVDTGWQPAPDGGLEYIIQIEPDLIDVLREGRPLTSEIPADLQDVRRYRIQIGSGEVPRIGLPTTVSRPTGVDAGGPSPAGPLSTSASPLPSSRPIEPPAALESVVPPVDEAYRLVAPAGSDPLVESGATIASPSRNVIRSEPLPNTIIDSAVVPASGVESSPALKPLHRPRRPGVEDSPPLLRKPRPSLPPDENTIEPQEVEAPPGAAPAPAAAASPAPEPAVVEPAPLTETMSRTETAPVAPVASEPPATNDRPKPRIPALGTTPRIQWALPPTKPKATDKLAAPSEAEGPSLFGNDAVPLPQEPIKIVDPASASPAPKAEPTTPAPSESPASHAPAPAANAAEATPPDASASSLAPATLAPTIGATIAATPAAGEAETKSEAPASGPWDWLGNRRNASRPFDTPTTPATPDPAMETSPTVAATPEAVEASASRTEPASLVSSSAETTGSETPDSAALFSGPGVKIGSWSIPAGVLFALFVASLGANLFLGWVAWGMQTKFARLAQQYQISQWKSPSA